MVCPFFPHAQDQSHPGAGVYINLFLLSIYTLTRRRETPGNRVLIAASCIGVNIAETVAFARFVQQIVHVQVLNPPKSMTTVMVVESGLLAINKYVIAGMLSTVTLRTAYALTAYVLGAATNIVLSSLTVGRILWIRRAASHVGLDSSVRSQYNRAIGIILESGAIYCIGTIFLAIAVVFQGDIYHIGISVSQEMLNIIPTFTLVYVGLQNNAGNGPPGASLLKPNVTRFDSHAV
ncbi:hypothetical protein B0H14DRAFT_2825785 [Mycena olivaceomarginata]|nr:hypothetical protein B0H14DRAFT_2825785 [Mycena olivaceomarginata]